MSAHWGALIPPLNEWGDATRRTDQEIADAVAAIEAIYEQGFKKRAEAALVEARRLGCGLRVTFAHGSFATAQVCPGPEVPLGKANVYQQAAPPDLA